MSNLRVVSLRALQPASCVHEDAPGDVAVYSQVIDARQAVSAIAAGTADEYRLLLVVGPPRGSRDQSHTPAQRARRLSMAQRSHASRRSFQLVSALPTENRAPASSERV